MKKYDFVKTKDGSVGLYNYEVDDIYHSGSGALTEAINKFIIPSGFINFVKNNKKVKILDICYGIGYNSKSAVYLALKNNLNCKIEIDALEIDNELVMISPFIKDSIPSIDVRIKIAVSLFIKIENYISKTEIILNKIDPDFLDQNSALILKILKQYTNSKVKYAPSEQSCEFLHNIYYQYVSYRIKNELEGSKNGGFVFVPYCNDARQVIQTLDKTYDFIFLDAFTPQKDPTLWTFDFLSLLKSKMNKNSNLITYSNSTPFRSALLDLGFNLGKVLIKEKQYGTVASLNPDKIIYKLDSEDIGITKTQGGILYRDPFLNSTRSEIIKTREQEKKTSDRISTSRYKKDLRKLNV